MIADQFQLEREIPFRSREVALKMVLEVSLARFLPSTERDGASMLKRLLETRKTDLKSQSQSMPPTAKSLH